VTSTRMRGSEWVTLFNSQVNDFYNRATFNKTNFTFELSAGSSADGWYSLGYARSGYEYKKTGQDAINLVDPSVDFSQYNGVLVITNNPDFGGQTNSSHWWLTSEGGEQVFIENGTAVRRRQMGLSIINEWHAHDHGLTYDEAAAVGAHEIGHQLDLQTHYADIQWHGVTRESITRWDVMGLSPFQHHFLGWAKADRQWLIPARVTTVSPPDDRTINLSPQERDVSGTQLIKIPLATRPFMGYVVENRQRINGDEGLASAGVLVSLVDESPMVVYGAKDIVMDNEPSPGQLLDGAALDVGGSFVDTVHNINISVISRTVDNYNVRVQYPLPSSSRPNLMITPWGAPPYYTPDIWLDSEKNGWDAYRYTDGAGNPSGQGDDAWINHANRVYVRVHNLGPGVAANVRVQVYFNSPPGMGDAGPDWRYIGTILFPTILPSSYAQDFVLWTPTIAVHTCIRAVIEPLPGEIGTGNHSAQENIVLFDSTEHSPWKAVNLKIRVYNPHKENKTPVSFNIRDIPKNWAVEIKPMTMTLPPGGSQWVKFGIYPSGAPGSEERGEYQPGYLGKPIIEALVPYADTFIPIGGVEVWTNLVNVTKLTCFPKRAKKQMIIIGYLKPGIADAKIAIEITSKRKRLLYHVNTDVDGKYVLELQDIRIGSWSVQAFFDGDMMNAPAQSSSQSVK
jgi:M6 family metalloprotease-like protein